MRTYLLLGFISLAFLAIGQDRNTNPFPKTITVTGSAEMETVPDQIYVNITLREYQKRGENKKDLETIKNDFIGFALSAGLSDSAISILAYTGYNNYYWLRKKKKNPDLFASITYQVKFTNSKQMDDLIDRLDDEATQSFVIASTSHSKMTEFRKQLKIQAVKMAKEKAAYLTEAIGEKLGGAITVKEPEEPAERISPYSTTIYSNVMLKGGKEMDDKGMEIDFKKIKLRYEVTVIFALQ